MGSKKKSKKKAVSSSSSSDSSSSEDERARRRREKKKKDKKGGKSDRDKKRRKRSSDSSASEKRSGRRSREDGRGNARGDRKDDGKDDRRGKNDSRGRGRKSDRDGERDGGRDARKDDRADDHLNRVNAMQHPDRQNGRAASEWGSSRNDRNNNSWNDRNNNWNDRNNNWQQQASTTGGSWRDDSWKTGKPDVRDDNRRDNRRDDRRGLNRSQDRRGNGRSQDRRGDKRDKRDNADRTVAGGSTFPNLPDLPAGGISNRAPLPDLSKIKIPTTDAEAAEMEAKKAAQEAEEAKLQNVMNAIKEGKGNKNVKAARKQMFEKVLDYTDQQNPFGDQNLSEKFVWTKKVEREQAAGKYQKKTKEEQTEKYLDNIREIQRVRQRREERMEEQALMEKNREQMEMEKLMDENAEWFDKEEEFEVDQVKAQMNMRIEQGREHIVDLLLKALCIVDGSETPQGETISEIRLAGLKQHEEAQGKKKSHLVLLRECPTVRLQSLSLADLEKFAQEIVDMKQFEHTHEEYWSALEVLAHHQLNGGVWDRTEGDTEAAATIDAEVHEMLGGQTQEELTDLEAELKGSLGDEDVDVAFYNVVLRRIPYYRSKQLVQQMHTDSLRIADPKVLRTAAGRIANNEEVAPESVGKGFGKGKGKQKLQVPLKNIKKPKPSYEPPAKFSAESKAGEASPEGSPESSKGSGDAAGEVAEGEAGKGDAGKGEGDAKGEQKDGEANQPEDEEVVVVGGSSGSGVSGGGGAAAGGEAIAGSAAGADSAELEEPVSPRMVPLNQLLLQLKSKNEMHSSGFGATTLEQQQSQGYFLIEEKEDVRRRLKMQQSLTTQYGGVVDEEGDKWFAQQQANCVRSGEIAFNTFDAKHNHGVVQQTMAQRVHYDWEKKYKPRKPRYFNRVKQGFDWNKYNSSHYDSEIPPPKMTQGYRFNIFYPDLVDKSRTPAYFLEKDPDAPQKPKDPDAAGYGMLVIRFSAGPPYEDISFKIEDREWNLEGRHGFRAVFDKGVFQLYFNFKRWRYRR